jgi:hypothetical protein
MERHQDIAANVLGQSLVWDAPEGRPSSVTSVSVFRVYTGDTGSSEAATDGTAAIDDVNTTLDAASGDGQADPRVVNLAATTDIVAGREYLLTGANGAKEWVDVVEIDSGVSITARHPLANGYASADTFEGTRITIALADAWIQDQSKISQPLIPTDGYRVRWVYVVDSVTYVHDGYFRVVRYPGKHSVTPIEIDETYPGFRDWLPEQHRADSGRRLIDEAWEGVRWDLFDSGFEETSVRDVDAINRAVVLRFGVLIAKANLFGRGGRPEALEVAERDYNTFINKVVRVTQKLRISASASGDGAVVPSLGIWEK